MRFARIAFSLKKLPFFRVSLVAHVYRTIIRVAPPRGWLRPWREGACFSKKKNLCGCSCQNAEFEISIYAIPIFVPLIYQFCTKNTQVCSSKVIFTIICSIKKIHPIYANLAPSSMISPHPIPIPKFMKKHPTRQVHRYI